MTRLHMLIGGLNSESPADFPHLARLIARGRPEGLPVETGNSAVLARLFGIEMAELAAVALAAEGIAPGTERWFHADPVHLLAGMHSLTLFDSRHFRIEPDESAALLATLNRHFAGEIEFLAPHPMRWYARFRKAPTVDSPPLDAIAGKAIAADLIAGPDARELQRITMEIQMLLHDHPVNEAREERNEASLNSLWFTGGGSYRKPEASFDQVMADDFQARALAAAAGIRLVPLTANLGQLPDGHTLVILDRSRHGQHDEAWFAPALRSLQRGDLEQVRLTLTASPPTHRVVDRWRSLRFWINR